MSDKGRVGLAASLGERTASIAVGGKEYTLTAPSTRAMFSEMEAHLRQTRPDPLEVAAASIASGKIPPKYHDDIWDKAMKAAVDRTITGPDVARFINSMDGIAFTIWITLREHQLDEFPDATAVLNWIDLLMEEAGARVLAAGGTEEEAQAAAQAALAEVRAKAAVVSGEADLPNSSGRSQTGPA